eukprot:TRINITY_DN1355_c0_g1_i1.p1 TRINITY_DN1355_c0_g1~~TRINITY_DN1355_c0_g1_i1.p1  ORF type:complete len:555 (-),score=121.90 TRINITY_DN1355_c0_g1_i1:507-2171(-)
METYVHGEIGGVSEGLSGSRLLMADTNGCMLLLNPNAVGGSQHQDGDADEHPRHMELHFPASEANPSGGFKHLSLCFNAHIGTEEDGVETVSVGVLYSLPLKEGGKELVFSVFQTKGEEQATPSQKFHLFLSKHKSFAGLGLCQCVWIADSKWAVCVEPDVFLVDIQPTEEIPLSPHDAVDIHPLHTFTGRVCGIRRTGNGFLTFGKNWIAFHDIDAPSMSMHNMRPDGEDAIDDVWSFTSGSLFVWAGLNIFYTDDMNKHFLETNVCMFKEKPHCVTLFKQDGAEPMNVIGAYLDAKDNIVILKFDHEVKAFAHLELETARDGFELFSLGKTLAPESSLIACSSCIWNCSHNNKIVCLDIRDGEGMTEILSARYEKDLIRKDGRRKAHAESWEKTCALKIPEDATKERQGFKRTEFHGTWTDYYWGLFCAARRHQQERGDVQPIVIHRGEETKIDFPLTYRDTDEKIPFCMQACDIFATYEGMDDMVYLLNGEFKDDTVSVPFAGLTPGLWTVSVVFGRRHMCVEKVVNVLDAPYFTLASSGDSKPSCAESLV